jgi:hypothetical protein
MRRSALICSDLLVRKTECLRLFKQSNRCPRVLQNKLLQTWLQLQQHCVSLAALTHAAVTKEYRKIRCRNKSHVGVVTHRCNRAGLCRVTRPVVRSHLANDANYKSRNCTMHACLDQCVVIQGLRSRLYIKRPRHSERLLGGNSELARGCCCCCCCCCVDKTRTISWDRAIECKKKTQHVRQPVVCPFHPEHDTPNDEKSIPLYHRYRKSFNELNSYE